MTRLSLSRIAQTWRELDFCGPAHCIGREVHLVQAGGRRPKGTISDHHENPGLPFIRTARLAELLMPDEGSLTLYIFISALLPHRRLARQTRTYQTDDVFAPASIYSFQYN